MTQQVTVYRWDDAGAPQIGSGNLWPGILNILKKCLVEGYGSKAAAGWTVEYEDAPGAKCVFRNDPVEGSGGYVQFWRYTDQVIWFKSGLFMPGLDDFVNPGYVSSLNLSTTFNAGKWILIASKTAVYIFFCTATETTYSANSSFGSVFFGDIISFIKNDPSTFCTIAYQGRDFAVANNGASPHANVGALNQMYVNFSLYNPNAGYLHQNIMLPLTGDGTPGSTEHMLTVLNSVPSVGRISGPPLGPQHTDRMYLALRSNIPGPANLPQVRGYLPGLISLPAAYHYLSPWPLFDDDYLLIWDCRQNNSTQGGGRRWINTVAWELPNRD